MTTTTTTLPVFLLFLLLGLRSLKLKRVCDFLDTLFGIFIDISETSFRGLVHLCALMAIIVRQLGSPLSLLHLTLQLESIAQDNKLLVASLNLIKLCRRGQLKHAKLCSRRVIKIRAVLIFVCEHSGALSLTLTRLLGFVKAVELVALLAFGFRCYDLNLALLNVLIHLLFAGLFNLLAFFVIFKCLVVLIYAATLARTEID